MKTSFSIFVLVLLATFLGCAANLQRPDIQEQPLAPSDRIRVSVSKVQGKRFFVGSLVALDADTLKIWINRCEWDLTRFLENQVSLPLASVTKVEVSRGKKSNGLIGAGIGALVGAGTGAVIGFSLGDDPPLFGEPFPFSAERKAAILALLGGGIGAIIGALIGAKVESEYWEEVPLEKVRMSNLRR